MPRLSHPKHCPQDQIDHCLPACVQMVLSQFGLEQPQASLAKRLGTISGLGTPFPNIDRLSALYSSVEITEWGGLESLRTALNRNQAVIAALLTSPDLPGWETIRTQHSVLVTDLQTDQIEYHDLALPTGPIATSLNRFLLAWSDMSELMATLQYSSPKR